MEANRLLQIFLMDYRDLMAWMTDLAMRISSGEPAKNVREAEALLELHMERKVPNVQMRSFMLFYCGHLFPVALMVMAPCCSSRNASSIRVPIPNGDYNILRRRRLRKRDFVTK